MEKKSKKNFNTICSQVELFLEENELNIYEQERDIKKEYIKKYAEEFSITFFTAKEHFAKYKDYLFISDRSTIK